MVLRNTNDDPEGLPTKSDFCPWGPTDPDGERAWKHFGGLTLPDARTKFEQNPMCYQEDFMFMGGKAFAFYFPVIEDYLFETPDKENDNGDDRQSWILAKCIANQLRDKTAPHVLPLAPRVIALSHFVRQNLRRFGYDDEERKNIADAWHELEDQIRTLTNTK